MDKSKIIQIRTMADDPDWRVREAAADEIKLLNDKQFAIYLPIWREWVRDPNRNIRRAVAVGLLRVPKRYYAEAFDLLEPLLYDSDEYVRKNTGPFALSQIANRNPLHALARFEKLIATEDEMVRWNIANCLGVNFGMRRPEQVLPLLETLARDPRRFVWRAAAGSLVKLLRRHAHLREQVYAWEGVDEVVEVVKGLVEK